MWVEAENGSIINISAFERVRIVSAGGDRRSLVADRYSESMHAVLAERIGASADSELEVLKDAVVKAILEGKEGIKFERRNNESTGGHAVAAITRAYSNV